MGDDDTVSRVVGRLRARGPTDSVLHDADRLLRRVEPVARRAATALVGGSPSADAVEDIVQLTLEIAWRRLPDFDTQGDAAFESWIRGIARKVAANERRRRRDLLTEDGLIEDGDPTSSVLTSLQREERDQLVTDAIATALEGVEQDVIYHRYVQGLERDHIAELLDLADANAVRVVMQRAQRKLKTELERRLTALQHGRSYLGSIGD